ncbi:MAG: hypothetical protein ACR2MS_05395 [Weeksellaceae bacterium]
MKNIASLILFQLLLSVISAFLLSEMSFFGKMGISLFYKEYSILKNPFLTGIIIFCIQVFIIAVLQFVHAQTNRRTKNFTATLILIFALAGLYFTYLDFTEEFSHRILKSKFHFGGYLIWIGIMTSCIFYLFKEGKNKKIEQNI